MALTKADKEYLDLKIKDVVAKTTISMAKSLPCEAMRAKVDDHDNILHNGIKDSMDRVSNDVHKIEKKVDNHIKEHESDRKERAKDKRAFWRGFKIALVSATTGGLFAAIAVFLIKYLIKHLGG